MRLAFDQLPAPAVRLSIAAAMVIRNTCQKLFTIFAFATLGDLRREMSTKSNNNAPPWGMGVWDVLGTQVFGDLSGVGKLVHQAGADGARLFQLLCKAEA